MGNCCERLTPEERAIRDQMAAKKEKSKAEKKLLFLGAGGSGKSTLFKQMEIIHGEKENGEQESAIVREWPTTWKPIIYSNITRWIKLMCESYFDFESDLKQSPDEEMEKMLRLSNPSLRDTMQAMISSPSEPKQLDADMLLSLWNESSFKAIWEYRGVIQVEDSLAYYMKHIKRIAAPDYAPTKDDVLKARARTTGIVEKKFVINGHVFKIIDVGGQRNERKKWFSCFDEVTAVIFVAALSAFDQVLFEEDTVNRMQESLKLFEEILENQMFNETDMILFLNKADLFLEKLKAGKSISTAFPDYKGGQDMKQCYDYVRNQFKAKNKKVDRQIFVHMTTATNTNQVEQIFNDVQNMIVRNSLRRAGLIG